MTRVLGKKKNRPIAYINGRFYQEDRAKVSVLDHGLMYGDGIYEAMRTYQGKVFKLEEHLSRLYESAKSIELEIPLSKDELAKDIYRTLRRNNLAYPYLRLIVTRGKGSQGIDPRNCPVPTIIILPENRPPPFRDGAKSATAIIASVRRTPIWALNPRVKSLNYLNNIVAKIEAIKAGVDEAIMLNEHGYVAEATTENVFTVKDGIILTPPLSAGILKGVTRDTVIELSRSVGMSVEDRNITADELITAYEVFLTGTAVEIAPVTKINGKQIGDGEIGPVVRMVMENFRQLIENPSRW